MRTNILMQIALFYFVNAIDKRQLQSVVAVAPSATILSLALAPSPSISPAASPIATLAATPPTVYSEARTVPAQTASPVPAAASRIAIASPDESQNSTSFKQPSTDASQTNTGESTISTGAVWGLALAGSALVAFCVTVLAIRLQDSRKHHKRNVKGLPMHY